jgi:hypothetical protein
VRLLNVFFLSVCAGAVRHQWQEWGSLLLALPPTLRPKVQTLRAYASLDRSIFTEREYVLIASFISPIVSCASGQKNELCDWAVCLQQLIFRRSIARPSNSC